MSFRGPPFFFGAGFFAGAAHTPISTIIMVSEMTGNYDLLVPAMLVCIVAFMVSRRWTLYEKQLPTRLDAHLDTGTSLPRRLGGRPGIAGGDGRRRPVAARPGRRGPGRDRGAGPGGRPVSSAMALLAGGLLRYHG